MPTIFCNNDGCMFSDGCGFCDCDKLSIVDGVCEGSVHGGRNASDGDIDERLKAENAKLRDAAERDADVMESLNLSLEEAHTENAKLRELFGKVYGYYVSGTLTPCDFCDIYSCEGNAPIVCKADEYDPDGIVTEEIDRLMRELGIEV